MFCTGLYELDVKTGVLVYQTNFSFFLYQNSAGAIGMHEVYTSRTQAFSRYLPND